MLEQCSSFSSFSPQHRDRSEVHLSYETASVLICSFAGLWANWKCQIKCKNQWISFTVSCSEPSAGRHEFVSSHYSSFLSPSIHPAEVLLDTTDILLISSRWYSQSCSPLSPLFGFQLFSLCPLSFTADLVFVPRTSFLSCLNSIFPLLNAFPAVCL